MKVIIAGSRNIVDIKLVINVTSDYVNKIGPITEIVSGGARGVDKLGEHLAKTQDVPCRVFIAEWDRYGKQAGYLRNQKMGKYADGLIALWDDHSRGTLHMINIMKSLKKPIYIGHVSLDNNKQILHTIEVIYPDREQKDETKFIDGI